MKKCELLCEAYCNGMIRKCKACKQYLSPNAYSCINAGGSMDTCDECLSKIKE